MCMARDPYEVLGIKRGATLAELKAAYRQLAKQYHPDYYPNDPVKTTKMAEVNAAYDEILDAIRGGGEVPFAGSESKPDSVVAPFHIFECSAPAGTGKTRGWSAAMADASAVEPFTHARFTWPPAHQHREIYASPTIDLAKQTAHTLKEMGVNHWVCVYSGDGTGASVQGKLAKHFAKVILGQPDIVVCTHAAIVGLPDVVTDRKGLSTIFDAADWSLTLDEAPDVVTFLERHWPETRRTLTRWVEAVAYGNGLMRLVPYDQDGTGQSARRLRALARGGTYTEDDGLESFKEPAEAIGNPRKLVLIPEEQWCDLEHKPGDQVWRGQLDMMAITLPEMYGRFRSFAMLGARIEQSMAHVVWQQVANVRYHAHPLQRALRQSHSPEQGRRLHIRYMFEPRASRQMLMTPTADGSTMWQAMWEAVVAYFARLASAGGEAGQFIWSAPRDRKGSVHGVKDTFWNVPQAKHGTYRPFDPHLRLSGKSHGSNKFRDVHGAALLSIVNFTPMQYHMLHAIGLSNDEIFKAHSYSLIYQDALRTSLRDPAHTEPVHIIVPDRPAAEDLASLFPECTLERLPDDLVPQRAQRRKPAPQPSGNATPSAERSRRHRLKQRAVREHKAEHGAESGE